jgi:DNA-binding PadR family transcriptional regulator
MAETETVLLPTKVYLRAIFAAGERALGRDIHQRAQDSSKDPFYGPPHTYVALNNLVDKGLVLFEDTYEFDYGGRSQEVRYYQLTAMGKNELTK